MGCDVAPVPLGGAVETEPDLQQVSFHLFHLQSLLSSENICKEKKNILYL